MLPELQSSYQADRKTQAELIMSNISSNHLPTVLPPLTCELLGFFVVEMEVLRTTTGFRNMGQVEELWEVVSAALSEMVENGMRYEKDLQVIVEVKETLVSFVQVMEASGLTLSTQTRLLDLSNVDIRTQYHSAPGFNGNHVSKVLDSPTEEVQHRLRRGDLLVVHMLTMHKLIISFCRRFRRMTTNLCR